jgi:RNA polymerase sigma factor (TIGR02999 family)
LAGSLTQYANRWRDGDEAAGDKLFRELDRDLRMIAQVRLHSEAGQSLSAGDLVNEAVLRLAKLERIEWASRPHILALASTLMRQFLIDHARRNNSQKRAHERVTLCTGVDQVAPAMDVLDLNEALEKLALIDQRRANIVEMRYFGGMTVPEIAVALDVSESTVKRLWASARAWLHDHLAG